tara:strand:- start:46 stop:240 length:195 start_codon:yes stop_codon:yes gene_type:complete
MKYAVMFEPFKEDGLIYVRKGCASMWDMWTEQSPIKVFDTRQDAQKEADKWNTGIIVEYEYEIK